MKLAKKGKRPKTFRDLDPKVRARELASLQEELKRHGPITKNRLDRWIGACG